MLSFLPAPLIGFFALCFLLVNTVFFAPFILAAALFRIVFPISSWQVFWTKIAIFFASAWVSVNSAWMKLLHPMQWHIEGLESLEQNQWYFVVSNHQSWADIFIAQHLLNWRVPMLKFFLKQELIWVPIIGLCWWALDFPFMKRYSAPYLKKHPEKRGKDYESTLKACEKFKRSPVAIMNYLEGTRFTAEKHKKQNSPLHYLLKPKTGGIGYALSAMGENIQQLLNITIFYPNHQQPGFWDFLSGKVNHVCIRIEQKSIPADFLGKNYMQDREFKTNFNQWVNELWQEKDQAMADLHEYSKELAWSQS